MSDKTAGRVPIEKWAVYSETANDYWKSSLDDESSITVYDEYEYADKTANVLNTRVIGSPKDWTPVRLTGPEDRKP